MGALVAAGLTADPGIELTAIPDLHLWVHPQHVQVPYVPLTTYAKNSQLTEMVDVPGSSPPARVRRGCSHLLMVLRSWFGCFWLMHQAGYSLKGQFTPNNFLVYYSISIDVRMTGPLHLVRFTPDRGSEDYHCFIWCVEQILSFGETVPPHISSWLDLIGEGYKGNEYLIRYNTGLMELRQAFTSTMSLRRILERLRRTDPYLFKKIIIKCGYLWWDSRKRCRNTRLEDTRQHNAQGLEVWELPFEANVSGVLLLGRHCSNHQGVNMEHLMLLILEDDFPGLAADFQRVMYEAGLLHLLRLPTCM